MDKKVGEDKKKAPSDGDVKKKAFWSSEK